MKSKSFVLHGLPVDNNYVVIEIMILLGLGCTLSASNCYTLR